MGVQIATTVRKSGSSPLVGDVQLVEGTNITLTQSGQNITVAASGGSSTWTEAEIDFGTSPERIKTFTVTDAAVSGTSKVMVVPSGTVATSRVGNDAEWDSIIYTALAGTGNFTLTAMAVPGPVKGARTFFYQVT
jgi:hypothetical protein